jgi:hypothetical protein
MLKKRNRR